MEDLDPDPIRQFVRWLNDAEDAGIRQANSMVLATVDAAGAPVQRAVLLKKVSEAGFVFFTNLESRKARQMGADGRVSLHFLWMELYRQVSVSGVASRLGLAANAAYFATRPRESQIGAWASRQSRSLSSRRLLEEKFAELKRKFADGEVPLPSFWGGYRVEPLQMEFWQGREHRLHDRFLYTRRQVGSWSIDRLYP